MSNLFIYVGGLIWIAAVIGIIVNCTMMYFTLRHKKLRQLSVGGLIVMIGLNAALMNVQFLMKLPESVRYTRSTLVSFRVCTLEQAGLFFTTPAGKATLLLLSIDRIYAVFKPFRYRSRNHNAFAILAFGIIYVNSTLCLLFMLSTSDWRAAKMPYTCRAANTFTSDSVVAFVLWTLALDLLTYVLNGVLVYKVRHTSIVAPTSKFERLQRSRQRAITKYVLSTVLLHFACTTVPFVFAAFARAVAEAGYITEDMFNLFALSVTLTSIVESICNTLLFVHRLPDFERIVRRAFGMRVITEKCTQVKY